LQKTPGTGTSCKQLPKAQGQRFGHAPAKLMPQQGFIDENGELGLVISHRADTLTRAQILR
jgi:hypothetical protein